MTMLLGPALIARLEADADVAALVGSRIYWLVRPQGKTGDLPCLVLQEIFGERPQHLKGWQDMREATVQVGCLSLRYSESRALAEAVIACLVPVADVENPDGDNLVFWRGAASGPHDLGNQEETRFVHRAVVDITLRYGTAPVVPPLQPLAVSDFKAGTYEIGGVPTTLAGMFIEGSGFLYSQVEPGVGWRRMGEAPPQSYNFAQATPALLALLTAGATAVIQFHIGSNPDLVFETNAAADDGAIEAVQVGSFNYPPDSFGVGIISTDYGPPESYSYNYDFMTTQPEPGMLHRLAATLTDPQLAQSFDGRPPQTLAGFVLGNDPLPGPFKIGNLAQAPIPGPDAFLVIERVTIYPPQAPADLPALSAVPAP